MRYRNKALLVSAVTALTLLTGCSSAGKAGTFFGPSEKLGAGTVKSYVTLDEAGKPTEFGVRMSATALDGLPPAGAPLTVMLAVPDQAKETAFDNVMLNWNPTGHDPAPLFGKPHFDMHFDMIDMASLHAIDPADKDFATKAAHVPDPKYVPAGYVTPPGAPLTALAVPGMGVHLVDGSDTSLVPGKYDFTRIIINGIWDGRYTFVEPMITRDWLLTKPTFEQPLKLPQAYQKNGYYPTKYAVSFDEQAKEYVVSVGGMSMRTAS